MSPSEQQRQNKRIPLLRASRTSWSNHKRFIKKWSVILTFVVFASAWITTIHSPVVGAKTYTEMTPRERALSWSYLKTLERCVDQGNYRDGGLNDRINDASAKSYRFFTPTDTGRGAIWTNRSLGVGHFLKDSGIPEVDSSDKNHHVDCGVDEGSTIWLRNALTLWGWESPLDFLCGSSSKEGIGAARTAGANCRNGNTDFQPFNKENMIRVIQSEVYGGRTANMDSASEYVYNLGVFYQACMGGVKTPAQGSVDTSDSRFHQKVKVVQLDGTIEEINYYGTVVGSEDIDYKPASYDPDDKLKCPELVTRINSGNGAVDYMRWIQSNPDVVEEEREQGEIALQPSCAVEGVGWVVCPVMTFMGGVGDAAYGLISNFLTINTDLVSTGSGTFTAWEAFRNIANVAFVLVFLVIIYSQITSAGVGSYGVKKMLPRLVVGAILVNISFFVCQLLVDITQILGATLSDFIKNIPAGAGENVATDVTWTNTTADILAGTGIIASLAVAGTIGAVVLALSISGPVLLAFVIAVLMTAVILIARQAGIVILIVLAPLAFVAYLLPNTENLFRKWLKTFWALLMVYPVVALLYGGGALAARIIHNSPEGGSFWMSITALGVSAIPLIMTPFLLKTSMSATGALGAKLQGWGNKANAGVGKNIREKSRFGEASQGIKNKFALNRATRRANSKFSQRIDQSRLGKTLGFGSGAARAAGLVAAEDTKDVENAVSLMNMRKDFQDPSRRLDAAQSAYEEAIKKGDSTQARAAQKILLSAGGKGVGMIEDSIKKNQPAANSAAMASMRSDLLSAGIKSKSASLDSWAVSSNGDLSAIQATSSTYTRLNNGELATQTIGNFREAIKNSTINSVTAQELLDNDSTFKDLSQAHKAELFSSFGIQRTQNPSSAASNNGAGANQPAQSAGGTGQVPTGTGVGTPQQQQATNNPSAGQGSSKRAQAQAKLNAATQGSSGSAPFFVASDGTTANTAGLATGSVKEAQAAQGTSGDQTRVFSVDESGAATEQTLAGDAGVTIDHSGRQTPGTVSSDDTDDYHDKMSR